MPINVAILEAESSLSSWLIRKQAPQFYNHEELNLPIISLSLKVNSSPESSDKISGQRTSGE